MHVHCCPTINIHPKLFHLPKLKFTLNDMGPQRSHTSLSPHLHLNWHLPPSEAWLSLSVKWEGSWAIPAWHYFSDLSLSLLPLLHRPLPLSQDLFGRKHQGHPPICGWPPGLPTLRNRNSFCYILTLRRVCSDMREPTAGTYSALCKRGTGAHTRLGSGNIWGT